MNFYSIFKTFLSEFQTIIKISERNSCGDTIFINKVTILTFTIIKNHIKTRRKAEFYISHNTFN